MTMPSYDDLLAGRLSVSSIRQVELEDLLGREAVSLDDAGLHDLLGGRVVLVTGAGDRSAPSSAGKSPNFAGPAGFGRIVGVRALPDRRGAGAIISRLGTELLGRRCAG